MAAKLFHQEVVQPRALAARLRQIRARKYPERSTSGDTVYESPHGWVVVTQASAGYVLKYYSGCPC